MSWTKLLGSPGSEYRIVLRMACQSYNSHKHLEVSCICERSLAAPQSEVGPRLPFDSALRGLAHGSRPSLRSGLVPLFAESNDPERAQRVDGPSLHIPH